MKTLTRSLLHRDGTTSEVMAERGPMPGTVRLKLSRPRKVERDGVVLPASFFSSVSRMARKT